MSLELVNSLATFGTFLVIAATAIAALVQLRHARGSNQIAALAELRDAFQSREFSEANSFLASRLGELLKDPAFRYQLTHRSARTDEFREQYARVNLIGNYYEDLGALVMAGLVDRDLTFAIYNVEVEDTWNQLGPFTAILRRGQGNMVWENFEYLAMLAKQWVKEHPEGAYPHGAARLPLVDEWLDADKQYAASLSPA